MQQLIGVYGASGFGKQVMPLIKLQYPHLDNQYFVFIDDNSNLVKLNGHQVLNYNDFLKHSSDYKRVVIAIVNSEIRELLANKLSKGDITNFDVQARDTVLLDTAELAGGSILCSYVCLTSNSEIGKFFHANMYSYVAYDCVIGDYVTFSPRVSCNGNIHIHDHACIDTGAVIKQGTPEKPLVIGAGAIVGMGSVVTKDVPAGAEVVGDPARALNKQFAITNEGRMLDSSFSPWPSFTQQEADAVSQVLLSNKVNYWTGQECRQFEQEFADWADSEYAIALGNGTLALDVALQALGIGAGDEVVVTPRTFIASISSVVNAGATPIFADIDEATGNITAETISAVLTDKAKAIICVHLAGWPCDMDAMMALADQHDLYVVEDCAQAHGARYKGRSVGSIGHVGAWSFCQDKIMTTGGEGGMVTTNNEDLWRKMWAYKDHGKSYAAVYEKQHTPGYRWLHESFGTNWRMTEMQGVIGRIQLERMTDWTAKRTANAQAILEVCDQWAAKGYLSVPKLEDMPQFADSKHAYYKLYVYVNPNSLPNGWSRDRIINEIRQLNVPCFSGTSSEVYLEKAFDNTGLRPELRLPMAKQLGETSLMFLVHPTLTTAEIEQTIQAINTVFAKIHSSNKGYLPLVFNTVDSSLKVIY